MERKIERETKRDMERKMKRKMVKRYSLYSHSPKQVFKGIIMPQALVFLYIFIYI